MNAADLLADLKKQPVGVACGLICLALGVLLFLRSSAIDERQAEYDAKSAEATQIVSNVSLSKNLPEQVQEIQALTKDLEARLVHAGQLAVNLQYFYKLEAENEVKLLDVRQNPVPKNATGYMGVSYNVTIQGTYAHVMTFLNRLENGRHFSRFSSVVLSKVAGNGDNSTNMTLTLNLELLGQP